ncbi:hypothetical protein ACB095_10420, partial [Streptococcus pneumoniae]|uniref:hypothetical protein n=1 Tax=Streptococcus pneumoniae TaxID=1313 RepID=UPI003529CAE6
DFYRSEHQKRKDEICPFSSLAFLQPTTVDKEPKYRGLFSKLSIFLLSYYFVVSSLLFDG